MDEVRVDSVWKGRQIFFVDKSKRFCLATTHKTWVLFPRS